MTKNGEYYNVQCRNTITAIAAASDGVNGTEDNHNDDDDSRPSSPEYEILVHPSSRLGTATSSSDEDIPHRRSSSPSSLPLPLPRLGRKGNGHESERREEDSDDETYTTMSHSGVVNI